MADDYFGFPMTTHRWPLLAARLCSLAGRTTGIAVDRNEKLVVYFKGRKLAEPAPEFESNRPHA